MLFRKKKKDDTQMFENESIIDDIKQNISEIDLSNTKRTTTEALRIIQSEQQNSNLNKSNTYVMVDVDVQDVNLELEKISRENQILKSQVRKYKNIIPNINEVENMSTFGINSRNTQPDNQIVEEIQEIQNYIQNQEEDMYCEDSEYGYEEYQNEYVGGEEECERETNEVFKNDPDETYDNSLNIDALRKEHNTNNKNEQKRLFGGKKKNKREITQENEENAVEDEFDNISAVDDQEAEPVIEAVAAESKEIIEQVNMEKEIREDKTYQTNHQEIVEIEYATKDEEYSDIQSIQESIKKPEENYQKLSFEIIHDVEAEYPLNETEAEVEIQEIQNNKQKNESQNLSMPDMQPKDQSQNQNLLSEENIDIEKQLSENSNLEIEVQENICYNDEKTEILQPEKMLDAFQYHLLRNTGEDIKITRNIFRIGKDSSFADYTIKDNATVSRRHAELIIKNNTIYIKDLNSTNGIIVGNFKIPPLVEVEVKDGQDIIISNEHFVLKKIIKE